MSNFCILRLLSGKIFEPVAPVHMNKCTWPPVQHVDGPSRFTHHCSPCALAVSKWSKMYCRLPNMVVADLIPNTKHVCVLRASANSCILTLMYSHQFERVGPVYMYKFTGPSAQDVDVEPSPSTHSRSPCVLAVSKLQMYSRFPNMVVADLIPNTQRVCVCARARSGAGSELQPRRLKVTLGTGLQDW